jgi:6-phosphogluconolactonase
MQIDVFSDADAVACAGARIIASEARAAIAARGRFLLALSGGTTPLRMLAVLAAENLPWPQIHIVQVDERFAPAGDPDRNIVHLRRSLESSPHTATAHVYPMPVEAADLNAAAGKYAAMLRALAGEPASAPPVLDLVHLGLGADGHTASLVPGDPVLNIADRLVAVTGMYWRRQRMTLTYPVLNAARRILWLVTGPEKAPMLPRLLDADVGIPAGRVNQAEALVLADRPAATALPG